MNAHQPCDVFKSSLVCASLQSIGNAGKNKTQDHNPCDGPHASKVFVGYNNFSLSYTYDRDVQGRCGGKKNDQKLARMDSPHVVLCTHALQTTTDHWRGRGHRLLRPVQGKRR